MDDFLKYVRGLYVGADKLIFTFHDSSIESYSYGDRPRCGEKFKYVVPIAFGSFIIEMVR